MYPYFNIYGPIGGFAHVLFMDQSVDLACFKISWSFAHNNIWLAAKYLKDQKSKWFKKSFRSKNSKKYIFLAN